MKRKSSWLQMSVYLRAILLVIITVSPATLRASQVFIDSFPNGLNPTNWEYRANSFLFTASNGPGYVIVSKPQGGSPSFMNATLASRYIAQGDFDVRLTFTNLNITRLTGAIGNQMQLNARFGGQDFFMVRSDETSFGQNVHAYANPPASVFGKIGWVSSIGTLRITRTNSQVTGFIDSVLIYQGYYNTNDVSFSLALQNNQNTDPISVTYTRFQLTADSILSAQTGLNIANTFDGNVVVSWKDTQLPDGISNYQLQMTTNLLSSSDWQTAAPQGTLTTNYYKAIFPVGNLPTYFRLKR